MKEHKITGLSCGHCASKLQEQIQQLPGGEETQVQFNSSKIILDEEVDMDAVRSIRYGSNHPCYTDQLNCTASQQKIIKVVFVYNDAYVSS